MIRVCTRVITSEHLSSLQDHLSGCDYLKVRCVHPQCAVLVKKALLPEHLKNECIYRLVGCDLCHTQIVFTTMTASNTNLTVV